ncbi:AP2-like ethylene-responsive transcription factor PLT1 [Humulus lupulus]|uniref:AP2-like ethylene-responsive transcription factor PLT1 n=1 Tax=Humulus lupulus TaxID=3486 RepID=UPI002B40A52C|nr:AP2-like ethylene-responsive transcription factor PLT1 [Humulus lupulus]
MEFFNSSYTSTNRQLLHPVNQEFSDFENDHGTTQDFPSLETPNFKIKSSKYRGVQKIKDKATYVAHVYDNGYLPKEGRTVYLGRFDREENAARAHDLVSLKFWGTSVQTNFQISDYVKAIEAMENMTDQDVVAAVRRSSNSFSRGKSKYRGVVKHANTGKWQARKGPGKESFLGTFETEEEAAIAFDIASIKLKGNKAITNFDIKSYNVKAILEGKSSELAEEDIHDIDQTASTIDNGKRRKKRTLTFHSILGNKTGTADQYFSSGNMMNMLRENSSPSSSSTAAASADNCANFIPFCSEIDMESSSSRKEAGKSLSLALGFQHSSSSAFKSYGGDNNNNEASPVTFFKLLGSNVYLPYEINRAIFNAENVEGTSTGLQSAFNHASSSCFKPFKKP